MHNLKSDSTANSVEVNEHLKRDWMAMGINCASNKKQKLKDKEASNKKQKLKDNEASSKKQKSKDKETSPLSIDSYPLV